MKQRPIKIGDVLVVTLPRSVPSGHEQEGLRPVIVIGLPHKIGTPRYPMLLIAPLTTQVRTWAKENPFLYPRLEVGATGLTTASVILLDQLRAIDERRIEKYIGSLDEDKATQIQQQILLMLGFL